MSSRAMPLATLVPRKGGVNTGLSVTTSGERGGAVDSPRRHLLALAGRQLAAPELAPEGGVVLARLLQLDEAVHGAQALEGVLAVEEAALVDLAEVALDVGARQGGPAQEHGDVGQAAGCSAPRGSRA